MDNFVKKFELWNKTIEKLPVMEIRFDDRSWQDLEGVFYLQDNIADFMTSVIGKIDGKILQAETRRVDDITDLKTKLELSGEKIYLYQLRWVPSRAVYTELSGTTGDQIPLAKPIVTGGFWLLRAGKEQHDSD